MGYLVVGPFDQTITADDQQDCAAFGQAVLSMPRSNRLAPVGLDSMAFGVAWAASHVRHVRPAGVDVTLWGGPADPSKPFMWQGVRVGAPVLGSYGGIKPPEFGDTLVSVTPRPISVQGVLPQGFDAHAQAAANVWPAARHIRPDGNSEQYRKGAF